MNFPHKFIRWVIISIKIISYRYNVNGEYTKLLVAKRGLKQGDPLSSMIFVLVMDYLYRVLQKLKGNLNFNFHSKCEKLGIINISFADELFLFSTGDPTSISLLMQAFENFVASTGLTVNPMKCKIYYGYVESHDKDIIYGIKSFQEGALPFRCLGIPP